MDADVAGLLNHSILNVVSKHIGDELGSFAARHPARIHVFVGPDFPRIVLDVFRSRRHVVDFDFLEFWLAVFQIRKCKVADRSGSFCDILFQMLV